MNIYEEALKLHEENKGKIEVISKTKVKNMHDLSVVYTPVVAEPCRKIHQDVSQVYKYTTKGNMVVVVTDGTAVLGLGDIGPEAALPVMEGKAVLFKHFAGVIVPHYFAGFSGGRKSILPGICGRKTIEANHAKMVHSNARAGNLKGNPVDEEMQEAAEKVGVDFNINVVTNWGGG